MLLIKTVSDLTKETFAKVWDMNIYEFFNYVAFDREYNRKQIELQNKYKQQHNIR